MDKAAERNLLDRLPGLAHARDELLGRFLGKPDGGNIVGAGFGFKVLDGIQTEVPCLRVYVNRKVKPPEKVARESRIPETTANGERTDVIAVGREFSSKDLGIVEVAPGSERAERGQPGSSIEPIVSVPNVSKSVVGTLGAILWGAKTKEPYILTCNHVLSLNGRLPLEVEIVPRGPTDPLDGTKNKITGVTTSVAFKHGDDNRVDCAVLKVETGDVKPDFPPLIEGGDRTQVFEQPVHASRGMRVVKFGKTTGTTFGTIVDVNLSIQVDYSFGTFQFVEQVLIEADPAKDGKKGWFAADGDSGAVVIAIPENMDRNPRRDQSSSGYQNYIYVENPTPVAMVFAPLGGFTVACKLISVFKELRNKMHEELTFAGPY